MGRTRILLDSNSYFRLAKSIHPLLGQEFGDARYCLYVTPDLDAEFMNSPRLRRKFQWVHEPEYHSNRMRPLQISRVERKNISQAYDFIYNHVRTERLAVSPVDVRALAMAYVVQVQVVTDDQDMLRLAAAFGIQTLRTLALMRLMLDCGHINMDRVRQIAGYWQYMKDTPAEFKKDYLRLFGEEIPPSL